jgi:chromosome segregation ATPase
MNEGTHAKDVLESGLWDAAGWIIATLAAAVTAMMRRTWRKLEERQDELEQKCSHDLNQHAVADARSHDDIRKELATELKEVNVKIDAYNERAAGRYDALSAQMSTQHGLLTQRVDKILQLMAGDKS